MKKNDKNKNKFFGLNASEKTKIVKLAVDKATKEQLDLVKRNGGVKKLKSYSYSN